MEHFIYRQQETEHENGTGTLKKHTHLHLIQPIERTKHQVCAYRPQGSCSWPHIFCKCFRSKRFLVLKRVWCVSFMFVSFSLQSPSLKRGFPWFLSYAFKHSIEQNILLPLPWLQTENGRRISAIDEKKTNRHFLQHQSR